MSDNQKLDYVIGKPEYQRPRIYWYLRKSNAVEGAIELMVDDQKIGHVVLTIMPDGTIERSSMPEEVAKRFGIQLFDRQGIVVNGPDKS